MKERHNNRMSFFRFYSSFPVTTVPVRNGVLLSGAYCSFANHTNTAAANQFYSLESRTKQNEYLVIIIMPSLIANQTNTHALFFKKMLEMRQVVSRQKQFLPTTTGDRWIVSICSFIFFLRMWFFCKTQKKRCLLSAAILCLK